MNKAGGRTAGMDPVFSSVSIDRSQSVTVKWIEAMQSSAFLPPETQSYAFNSTLILRNLTVDRVEPGLVISTLNVKPNITNVYDTLHGGVVAMIASIMGLAAVKTVAGDKEFVQTEMSISYMSAARIGVELEVEAKVLRLGKSIAIASIDIRNKDSKQVTFQGRCTFYSMPTSRI